jgi:hypothetical protein
MTHSSEQPERSVLRAIVSCILARNGGKLSIPTSEIQSHLLSPRPITTERGARTLTLHLQEHP